MVGQEAREQMELGTAVAQHTLGQGFDTAQETAAAQRAQGQGSDIVLEIVAAAALGLGKVAVQTSQFSAALGVEMTALWALGVEMAAALAQGAAAAQKQQDSTGPLTGNQEQDLARALTKNQEQVSAGPPIGNQACLVAAVGR